MVRIKDVADYVGVSTATVSNVINGKNQRVSKEMREKIQTALEELGYVRNRSAMMLAQTTSNMIGVVIPEKKGMKIALEDPYYSAFVGNLEYEIRKHDCSMYLLAEQTKEEIIRQAAAWNLEGLIVCNFSEQEVHELWERYPRGIVAIDCPGKPLPNVIHIATDDFGGGYQMGNYLLAQGHTKIAMLADNDASVDHSRWLGLKKAVEEAGLLLSEDAHIIFSPSEPVRELQLMQLLPKLREYTALFAASDFYALWISSFLQSHGIRIPDDISVTGFDDLIYASLARPKLTTMSQNIAKKAQMAVEVLLRLQEARKNRKEAVFSEESLLLPVSLVERESVRQVK